MLYCYELPNGGVVLIHLAQGVNVNAGLLKTMFELSRPLTPAGRGEHFDITNSSHLARARSFPIYEVAEADIPQDRSRRNHWILDGAVGRNRLVASAIDLPAYDAKTTPLSPQPARSGLVPRP